MAAIVDSGARYSRQARFAPIGEDGQRRIELARVCLIGAGALGTHIAASLVRAGVGYLRIIDRDVPELSNLQRQTLFTEADVEAGLPKAVAAAKALRSANRDAQIDPIVVDLNSTNIERLIAGTDFVVDGCDNFELRYLLNDACVKLGKPWIYGGIIGSQGMTMTIQPGITPCLRCVFPSPPPAGEAPTCETAGVIEPSVAVVAGLQSAEALKLASGCHDNLNDGLISIDVWSHAFQHLHLGAPNADCPACQQRRFDWLDQSAPSQTTSLCGRDAIQVLVHPAPALKLDQLAERWRPLGPVSSNRYLLRGRIEGYELTVFPDGRAIVKGTTDPAVARSVYARYIGM